MNTPSGMFRLHLNDFTKGLVLAVLAGVALPALMAFQTPGFDITKADWNQIFHISVDGGLAAFAGYLTKNFFSDSQGKIAGKIG